MIFVMVVPLLFIYWLQGLSLIDAHVTRENVGCAFHLTCSGAFNGSIGQKDSGQARASSNGSPSLFTWFGDAFSDQHGNGCWWTPPTFTLQCDQNQPPDHGFQVGCDGNLSFDGQTVFYECPTGVGDEVNIYLHPNGDQCHEITIQADNCAPSTCPGGGGNVGPAPGPNSLSSSGTAASSTATSSTFSTQGPVTPSPFTTISGLTLTTRITSTSTVTTTQPASTSSGCVEVGPNFIVLVDGGNPDTAYGPNAIQRIQVSPNASSIFDFHFDDADLGKTCELSFRIGNGKPFNLTGTGIVTFAALDHFSHDNTTYNSMPRIIETMGNQPLYEGVNHGFGPFPCPGSTSHSGILLTEAPQADTCLDCLQGDDIGMFLRKC